MATKHKLSNALRAFSREDTTNIDCGNGWLVEIKQFSQAMPALRKVQAEQRAAGKERTKPKAAAPSVVLGDPLALAAREASEKDNYMLGSKEADYGFFAKEVIVGWTGLKDDDGNEVPYSTDTAYEVLMTTGTPGEQLYRELLQCSLDSSLFMVRGEQRAEEDTKN